jgi:hypothetical protein
MMKRRFAATTLILMMASSCASNDVGSPTGRLTPSTIDTEWRRPTIPGIESNEAMNSPIDGGDDEVRTAFDWLMLGRIGCGREPRRCVIDDLAVPGSPVHVALTEEFGRRTRHGIFASTQGSHRHRVVDVVMIADDRAEVRTCHADDVVLMLAGADGRPAAIYDESLVSYWSTWTMQRIDGGWRWVDESIDQRFFGEDRCHR